MSSLSLKERQKFTSYYLKLDAQRARLEHMPIDGTVEEERLAIRHEINEELLSLTKHQSELLADFLEISYGEGDKKETQLDEKEGEPLKPKVMFRRVYREEKEEGKGEK